MKNNECLIPTPAVILCATIEPQDRNGEATRRKPASVSSCRDRVDMAAARLEMPGNENSMWKSEISLSQRDTTLFG